MGLYAVLNNDNIVVNIVNAEQDFIDKFFSKTIEYTDPHSLSIGRSKYNPETKTFEFIDEDIVDAEVVDPTKALGA